MDFWENNKQVMSSSNIKKPTNQAGLRSSPITWESRLTGKRSTNLKTTSITTTASRHSNVRKSTTNKSQNMEANNEGAGERVAGQQQVNGPMVSLNSQVLRRAALMKKSQNIRYDEYFDLSEEKRRLSSFSSSPSPSTSASTAATKCSTKHQYSESLNKNTIPTSQVIPSPLPQPITASSVPNGHLKASKCPSTIQAGAQSNKAFLNSSTASSSNVISLTNSNQEKANATTFSSTNGKSYLRSQYERRQLRQLELLNKMQQQQQQPPMAPSKLHIADGANIRRQHQQDLVAKSHELSKRRFFEKLERRESIKNLNLNTPLNKEQEQHQQQKQQLQKQPTTVASLGPSNKIIALESALDEQVNLNSKENLEVNKQKGLDEDELIRKVYQSIAQRKVNSDLANKTITLDSLAGAQLTVEEDSGTEELAVELIGFYTPSPQSPAEDEQERLIEFSLKKQGGERKQEEDKKQLDDRGERMLASAAHVTQADIASTMVKTENLYLQASPSPTNENSPFEVKVPAHCGINGPTMRETSAGDANTRCFSPGLLVVKQVEVDGGYNDLLQSSVRTVDSHVDDGEKRPPTLKGRLGAKISTRQHQKETNKTNPTPLDESTDNKVRLIETATYNNIRTTMPLVGTDEVSSCEGTRKLAASQEVGDNQQKKPAESISLTISSGNNNSIINTTSTSSAGVDDDDDDNSKSNKMKNSETIQTSLKNEQTTSMGRKVSGNLVAEESVLLSKKERVIEVCGASNCAKDHEAPETAELLVEQSGGAADNKSRTSLDNISSSAYPVQAQQSTAQAQQVASLQTTITNNTLIRHVQPKANEVNPTEAIVSEVIPHAKVVADAKQVNEVQNQRESFTDSAGTEDGYANVLLGKEDVDVNKADEVKNNVNLIENEVKTALKCEDIDSVDQNNHRHHLIESFKQHPNLLNQEQKIGISGSVVEEDESSGSGSSSCSSSGFGASASVTSSFDGSSTLNVTVNEVDSTTILRDSGKYQRRLNAMAHLVYNCTDSSYNPQYDSVKTQERKNRSRDYSLPDGKNNVDCNGYKELVGPDQSYPKGRVLLVENHNYASLVNHRSTESTKIDCSNHIVLERDDQMDGYANLPRKKTSSVEYATVRSFSTVESRRKTQPVIRDNLNLGLSSSTHSYSTTSAESGGFSAMPPAKVESMYANNFESLDSSADSTMRERKRSSLLKRFGSLVSRAFTGTNTGTGTQSATSLNNDDSLPPVDELKEENNTAGSRQKSALVIEQDHKMAANETSKVEVGEADLVILPTKHVNQRKPLQVQQREQNPALPHRDDDRLSREGKKLSRKLKKNPSSSASTSSSISSTFSDSRHHIEEHPKKSDSLFDELESLMSLSEHSTYYQRNSKNKRLLNRDRALTSSRRIHQVAKNSKARIDIDCISPKKTVDHEENLDVSLQSETNKSSGPLSLLRLFSSSSLQNRATESTPDLIVASSKTWRVPSQCAIVGVTEKSTDLQEPSSGFWGFSSLISQSHASGNSQQVKTTSQAKANSKSKLVIPERDIGDHDSLVHSSLQPFEAGYRLHLSSEESEKTLEKYQSMNLYRNLLRNYAKRRNHRRGHHHHHHHHHHRAHYFSTTARQHATAHRSERCAQVCKKNCHLSGTGSEKTSGSSCCCTSANGEKASVWGQLIKINKTDGSQVVELQRSHGKSWGFFVARGAINNVKGIFISRMHDTATSNSLTGLLSIGDRILAIDECPIEPDYDILRVNQMISKRSKIVLKVKPFKG